MNYKILIIDDDRSIHEDFIKVLNPSQNSQENVINDLSERIFSNSTRRSVFPHYEIHSAFDGKQAIELVKKSVLDNTPYALMFVDIKMGENMDGTPNFLGPFVHGPVGGRFLYLVWFDKKGESKMMFRRAKINLQHLGWPEINTAILSQKHIKAQVFLTDKKGGPACATFKPENINWL